MTTHATERDVEHARWLAELGPRGVGQHWLRAPSPMPDARAALRGLFAWIVGQGQLDREIVRRVVLGAWTALAPHPTREVDPAMWRFLFAELTGPSWDDEPWARPHSLTIFRGCADRSAAHSFSWTTQRAVARVHAEGQTAENLRRHASPRIFTTTAPRGALLARTDGLGEHEVIIDPDRLGEVEEIPREVWEAEFPAPIVVELPGGLTGTAPGCPPWDRYRLA